MEAAESLTIEEFRVMGGTLQDISHTVTSMRPMTWELTKVAGGCDCGGQATPLTKMLASILSNANSGGCMDRSRIACQGKVAKSSTFFD